MLRQDAYFNPRTPCGVRPPRQGLGVPINTISIHAPRVGCDTYLIVGGRSRFEFQSTHPVWGATQGPIGPQGPKGISIHAPRVGCDGIAI